MTNTSNKQHETGKPKGCSAKCLLKFLITGKLKPKAWTLVKKSKKRRSTILKGNAKTSKKRKTSLNDETTISTTKLKM